jgi:hypothetical protein
MSVPLTIERNTGPATTAEFKFKNVPQPARNDAATTATVTLIDGTLDPNSAPITALTDGLLPSAEDQPAGNVFFRANSWGGRVRIDLGKVVDFAQVNSYSWHPDTRGPQLYKLYASDGANTAFNPAPSSKLDPPSCGWKFIAFVDTRSKEGNDGGQYGVRIPDVGRYRFLLFDFFETESDDAWGNTFYSEIDVVTRD